MLDGARQCDCIEFMKMKLLALIFAASLTGLVTGCIETVDGRTEPGVPFVKNKIEGTYEVAPQRLFEAAKAVLARNGQLVAENLINNSLQAKVNQESVWVEVEAIDPKPISRITVQVRTRSGAGDVDLAHDLEKQIALQMVGH